MSSESDCAAADSRRLRRRTLPRRQPHQAGNPARGQSWKTGSAFRCTTSQYSEDRPRPAIFLLRRVLEQGLRPGPCCVDFSEDLLSVTPGLNPTCWVDTLGAAQSIELAWHSRDPRWRHLNRAALALAALVRPELPDCFLSGFPDLANHGGRRSPRLRPKLAYQSGSRSGPREFVQVEKLKLQRRARVATAPANAFYVDRLLQRPRPRAIQVFWILTPVRFLRRREKLEQNGVRSAYRQFIDERVPRIPEPDRPGRPTTLRNKVTFRDPIHVNRTGNPVELAVAAATKPRLSGGTQRTNGSTLSKQANNNTSKYQNLD